ncbi:hypothetical protein [[Mycobacterium] wendilense]|uniref:Scaffolding protein n=1 Tax=[Mycobacterium] wendilense TaxID=3064284 RepID=A0ABM9M8G5_9MYCO|nr:hypothetical protein [Mycolicibacterium sp. MU0050]CAJ1578979.1 hypothetical protein MU0050_000276 [Mycolicibacterium sp. MU0050]
MSETPDTPTETTEPVDNAQAPDNTADTDNRASEAKKYRLRAQAAEADRDTLRTQLTAMQRAEVERLAGQRLADGADIWHDNDDLTELLDDSGNVDTDRVTERVAQILTARPHWQKPSSATESTSTVTSRDRITAGNNNTFADAFKPKDRR